MAIKILFPRQLTLFQSPPTYFNMVVILCSKNAKQGHKTGANIFICLLDHSREAPFANMKMEHLRWPEMLLILRRSRAQYVAMVTKLLNSYCAAPLVERYCKKSYISSTNC